MKLFALIFTLLFPGIVNATPFELELHPTKQIVLSQGLPLAPPSSVQANEGDFFLYLNTARNSTSLNCGTNPLPASCLSASEWLERTTDDLLEYYPFRVYLQDWINEQFAEPLLNEQIDMPLIGDYNLAVHFEDLWNNNGCANPLSGPQLLSNPAVRIGCKYNDTDSVAINLKDQLLFPGLFDVEVWTTGTSNAVAIPGGQDHEGNINISVWISSLDLDMIFKQPEEDLQESGYYLFAAGKARLSDVYLEINGWTVGGNLRTPNTPGYSVGIDVSRIYLRGDLDLDLDPYDCTFQTQCDASALPVTHPDFNNQVVYQDNTNSRAETLGELLKYLEVNLVYEATRLSASAETYLTAMEVLDLSQFTHQTEPTFAKPVFEHPFGGPVTWDYGLWYKMNSASNESIELFGGADVDFEYNSSCDLDVPFTQGVRVQTLPYPPMSDPYIKAGHDSFVGAAIHRNLANRVLDELWKEGMLCLRADPTNDLVGSVLNVDTLRSFIPTLNQWEGHELMLEVRPLYMSPDSNPADFVPANDQPTFIFGDASPDLLQGDLSRPFDLHLRIPHVEFSFYVNTTTAGYPTWVKLFGVETRVDAYAGVGWYKLIPNGLYWDESLNNSGCDDAKIPCRVLRVNAHVESRINNFTDYNLSSYVSSADLENAISNLLTILINGTLEGYGDLSVNLVPVLGFTVDPAISYAEGNLLYRGTVVEPVDTDGDGEYEYLGMFLRLSDVYGSYDTEGTLGSGPNGYSDTLNPDMIFGLLEDAEILPASTSFVYVPSTHVDAFGFYADVPVDFFLYRIDGGIYQTSKGSLTIPRLFSGTHTIEAWGVTSEGYILDKGYTSFEVTEAIVEEREQVAVGCSAVNDRDKPWGFLFVVFCAYGIWYLCKRLDKK